MYAIPFQRKKKKRRIFLLKNVLIYRSFDYLRVSTGSIASDLSLDYAAKVSRINNAHELTLVTLVNYPFKKLYGNFFFLENWDHMLIIEINRELKDPPRESMKGLSLTLRIVNIMGCK